MPAVCWGANYVPGASWVGVGAVSSHRVQQAVRATPVGLRPPRPGPVLGPCWGAGQHSWTQAGGPEDAREGRHDGEAAS